MRMPRSTSRTFRSVAALTLIPVAVFLIAVCPPPASGLSASEESELGKKTLEKIRERMALVEDGEVLNYVQSVGNRIVSQIGTTPYQYQFFVVDQAVPNAFAVPGGYIFIYRGLIEMMSNEGELAGILSHELAHIQARHIHRRLEQGRVINIASIAGILAGVLLGVAGGGAAAQAVAMGSMAGAQSYQLQYSRENESEADQLGLSYLTAAGYPAKDMASVMEKLNQMNWLGGTAGMPSYLSTHPVLGERIQYLRGLEQKEQYLALKPKQATEGDFAVMKASLVAEFSDPQTAKERFLAGARQGDAAALYGLGRLYLRQGQIPEGVHYLQEAASKKAGSPYILSSLGDAYRRDGKLREAQRTLQTALLLDPSSTIAHFRLAAVLQDLGQKDAAYEHLHRIEPFAPTFPEIDYQLGVVLGQMGRVGEAHFYLGRYYRHKHDWKVALFHYQKAKAMIPATLDKREELEEGLKEAEKKVREAQMRGMKK